MLVDNKYDYMMNIRQIRYNKLKKVKVNEYPKSFSDRCIKQFLDKLHAPKIRPCLPEKKQLRLFLPYLGKLSLELRTRLVDSVNNSFPACSLRVIFRSPSRMSSCFKFKDRVPKALLSNVVYQYKCTSYYGKTTGHLKVWASEHLDVSPLREKPVRCTQTTAVKDHLLFCGICSLDNFSVIISAPNNYILELKESLMIHRDKPALSRNNIRHHLYFYLINFINQPSGSTALCVC